MSTVDYNAAYQPMVMCTGKLRYLLFGCSTYCVIKYVHSARMSCFLEQGLNLRVIPGLDLQQPAHYGPVHAYACVQLRAYTMLTSKSLRQSMSPGMRKLSS